MSNVYQNELRLDRNSSYWRKVDEKQKEFLLQKGDSILTLTGTVGKRDYGYSIQIEEDNKYLLNQRLVLLRQIKNKSYNDFIKDLISTEKFLFYFFAEAKGGTGNQTNVSTEDVKKIKLNIPDIGEQQKIASFLTSVDESIQQLSRKKELLEKYKKGIMQQLFSQKLRFKDENGKHYQDWKEKKLKEVAEKKSSNISANKIENNFGEYIIYGASGVLQTVDFYIEENDYVSIVKDGAGVGRLLYCKGKSSVLGTMEMISCKGIDTYFMFCLLSNIDFVKYVTGSTIPHIYFKDYSNEVCGIPSIKEQKKIANFLSSIDMKIKNSKQQIIQTQNFKKGLLQQMFV
ncbi:EcoKI restriction-modification system protein HsdS [Flavobacterium sp. TAB 87]|nr:EcoKI restriction-modification system protein HsdS [Flavobacterium sp. TAB 87]